MRHVVEFIADSLDVVLNVSSDVVFDYYLSVCALCTRMDGNVDNCCGSCQSCCAGDGGGVCGSWWCVCVGCYFASGVSF